VTSWYTTEALDKYDKVLLALLKKCPTIALNSNKKVEVEAQSNKKDPGGVSGNNENELL